MNQAFQKIVKKIINHPFFLTRLINFDGSRYIDCNIGNGKNFKVWIKDSSKICFEHGDKSGNHIDKIISLKEAKNFSDADLDAIILYVTHS